MNVLHDPKLEALLDRLHARSDAQTAGMDIERERRAHAQLPAEQAAANLKTYLADKLVALDRDKAAFCYQLCRAGKARRVVEIGTSYGVSTLYLAAAVRDNGGGVVIATEYEPQKAEAARAHFAQAGLSRYIDLREGDLRQTLQRIEGPVDFMLMDIWISMARPALELVSPHLRDGAMIVTDNTEQHRQTYADYFAFIADPANRLRTMTLPFAGGLELTVRCG